MPNLPFSYTGPGGKDSLLGSVVTGQGVALSFDPNGHSMVIRKGAKTAIDINNEQSDIYSTYYKQCYDSASVDRHMAKLASGGRPVFMDYSGEEGLSVTALTPEVANPSETAAIHQAAYARRFEFCRISAASISLLYDAAVDMAMVATESICTGDFIKIYDVEGTRAELSAVLGSNIDSEHVHSFFGDAVSKIYPTSGSGFKPGGQIFQLVRQWVMPGFVCVVLAFPTVGESASNNGSGWRLVALRRKTKVATRVALLEFRHPLSSHRLSETKVSCRPFLRIEMWVLAVSSAAPRLAIKPTLEAGYTAYLGWTDMSIVKDATYGSFTNTQPETIGASFGSYADFGPIGKNAVVLGPTYTATGGGTVTYPFEGDLTSVKGAELGFPDFTVWDAAFTPAIALTRYVNFGRTALPMGVDLCTNTYVDWRVHLDSVPTPVPLAKDMEVSSSGAFMKTKLLSSDLEVVLEALETHGGKSSLPLKTTLTALQRTFYGYVGRSPVKPPLNVLAKTKIYAMASEAGQDLFNEVLLPKDEDDAASFDVTFKQGDNLANSFRDACTKNARRGVVVVGTSTKRTVEKLAAYVSLVSGKFVFTEAVAPYTPRTDDELELVYASIMGGAQINFSSDARNSTAYKNYINPNGTVKYLPQFDLVCYDVFGASYGSITTETKDRAGDPLWTTEGQLVHGFLKNPEDWSPEFWLMVSATKSWRIEDLLGTLLTNPFGVGSLALQTISAVDS